MQVVLREVSRVLMFGRCWEEVVDTGNTTLRKLQFVRCLVREVLRLRLRE